MASETEGRSFVSIGNEPQDFFSTLLEYAQHLQPSYSSSSPKYDAAGLLADRLLSRYPNSIKQLRGGGARLTSITPSQLSQVCPELDPLTLDTLCTSFEAWDGVVSL